MRRTVALLTALLALLATSCSQFPGTNTAAPPRNDALIDAMANDIIFQADPITRDPGEAGCIAKAAFGLIGAARLNEAGVTVESANLVAADLTAAERGSVTDVITDCTGAIPLAVDTVDESASPQPVDSGREELMEYMVTDLMADPNAPVSNRAEARCMIEGTLELLGLDEAAVEVMAYADRDATRQEYNAMVDAYSLCADVVAEFTATLEDSGFYASEASCVARQFGRGNIVRMMKNSYDMPEDAELTPAEEAELFSAMDRCGIED